MATKNSGNSASTQCAKDSARAAQLKARGVVRTHGRCALCYRMIRLDRIHNHIATNCSGD